jgi:hypothetical protein
MQWRYLRDEDGIASLEQVASNFWKKWGSWNFCFVLFIVLKIYKSVEFGIYEKNRGVIVLDRMNGA